MPVTDPVITLTRLDESHIEGITALYNEPAVTRQVLQMPFQSSEIWRKRLAPDNEAAALDIADNCMNLRRVELSVYADNEGAIALYRKFGFETEGLFRDYAVRDGVFVDALSMARLRHMPKAD